jgi:hypothetical protein
MYCVFSSVRLIRSSRRFTTLVSGGINFLFGNTSNNTVYYRVMYDVMRINTKALIAKVDELIDAYIKPNVWNLCDDDPIGKHAM